VKFFRWEFTRSIPEAKQNQFEDVLQRLVAAQEGRLGSFVTPQTCMQSPTVHAIVTAISRRISVSPVHVYRKTTSNGLDAKERLPNHPVAKLLQRPNEWQTRSSYWLDAASTFARYGNFVAWKGRGSTGPIRRLVPIDPAAVCAEQDENLNVTFKVSMANGERREFSIDEVHHARGPARNFLWGDSTVKDVQTAITLEILAEKFGATMFQNGAVPLMIFKHMAGSQGFKNKDDEKEFVESFQAMFGGNRRHRAMLLPKNIEADDPVKIENDKAQFLETRKYQRTVIAGAWGVPPHLVGDLERATFNNVEQQDSDFTLNVIMPVAQAFESAMERDLLTDEDRSSGVTIRFNLDAILRADFKSRQEGLQIQRQNGAINPNEWREIEGRNPISDTDGGDDYIRPANMVVAGEEPAPTPTPSPSPSPEPDPAEGKYSFARIFRPE
jgi:HK97 family phage portal protein